MATRFARAHRKIAHVRGGGCKGAAGTLPPPLTNAAERGTIEIEKESLPVRRLAQVMKLLYEKVADSLDGGGYFFVS